MSKQVIGLHLLGWLAAILILVISLVSASRYGAQSETNASGMTWYWSKEILPDHLMYPFIMLFDKMALMTTPKSAAFVYMEVNYGYRRLKAAKLLVEKQKPALALTTLTKGQKYLNQAATLTLDLNLPVTDKKMVLKAIDFHHQMVSELQPNFTSYDQAVLDQLKHESMILEERLVSSLN